MVWYREHHRPATTRAHPSAVVMVPLGLVVAVASGIVGIGGPMLTVPLLVGIGVPVLESLAAAQVQLIVVASVGTLGYLVHDAVNWPLAALVGIPELAGVLPGRKVAQSVPARKPLVNSAADPTGRSVRDASG